MDKSLGDTVLELSIPKDIQVELFESITNQCFQIIRCYVLSHRGNIQDVEDVINDTYLFLSTPRKCEQMNDCRRHTPSYIIACAKNIWRKELLYRERNMSFPANFDPDNIPESSDEEAMIKQKQYNVFRKHFIWMSHECRKIIHYTLKKVPSREAAEKLGYTEDAYKKRKARTIAVLTGKIKNDPTYPNLSEE